MILKFQDSPNAKLLFKLIYLANYQHMFLEDAYLCVCLQPCCCDE